MQSIISTIKGPIKLFLNGIVDLVYPPLCLICEKRLESAEDQLCEPCMDSFKLIGKTHDNFSIPGEVFVHKAWALFDFDPAFQNLIHHLKYSRRRKPILRVLDHFKHEILTQLQGQHFDWIVSIPLHPRKRRERGYNQVDGVSAWLGEELNTEVGNHLVQRLKDTESQTKLNAEERQMNVAKAFAVQDDTTVAGGSFLLVDDVLTTGATANALAEILMRSGAKRVDLITLSAPS